MLCCCHYYREIEIFFYSSPTVWCHPVHYLTADNNLLCSEAMNAGDCAGESAVSVEHLARPSHKAAQKPVGRDGAGEVTWSAGYVFIVIIIISSSSSRPSAGVSLSALFHANPVHLVLAAMRR